MIEIECACCGHRDTAFYLIDAKGRRELMSVMELIKDD